MAASNIYLGLTQSFNATGCNTILSSGQACVVHRIAFVSKDGDWIIAEQQAACEAVINVLAERGARYRLGAPLDPRWLSGGWSSHLEYQDGPWRVRTDFVSRPARVSPENLSALWRSASGQQVPVVGIHDLIHIKRTMREKDYPIIGALAMRLSDPKDILLYSLAPETIIRTAHKFPHLVDQLSAARPLLQKVFGEPEFMPIRLAEERIEYQRQDRARMESYQRAIEPWSRRWMEIAPRLAGAPLREAHACLAEAAENVLPMQVHTT